MKSRSADWAPGGTPRRPRAVEALLLFGYVLLLVAAVVTVVVPELSKEPEPAGPGAPAATPVESTAKVPSTK